MQRGWILAGVAALLLYLPSLSYDFTYDDVLIIKENSRIHEVANLREYLGTSYWDSPGQNKEYRPLSMLSYAVNYALAGKDPISYHAVNIILHASVSIAAWWLLWMLFRRADLATLASVLFAVHPIHVEVVAGLVGRAEMMASLGFILTLLTAIKCLQTPTVKGRWIWGALSLLPAAIAVGSKENGLTVLPALVLLPFFFEKEVQPNAPAGWMGRLRAGRLGRFVGFSVVQRAQRLIPTMLFSGIAVVVYLLIRISVLGGMSGPRNMVQIFDFDNPLASLSGMPRLLSAFKMLARYGWMLVWPFNPSPDYSYGAIPLVLRINDPGWIIGVLGACFAAWAGWALRRRTASLFGICLFLITFVITSNIFFLIGTMLAERLLYLPSLGFCILVGDLALWAASAIPALIRARQVKKGKEESEKSKKLEVRVRQGVAVVCGLWMLAFVGQTLRYLPKWKDNETLFTYMVNRVPGSARAQNNFGRVLFDQKKFEEAIPHLQRSIEIRPQPSSVGTLGRIYVNLGRLEEAQAILEKANQDFPNDAEIVSNLARLYAAQNNREKSEKLYPPVIEALPKNYAFRRDFGLLLEEDGKPREAIKQLEAFIEKAHPEKDEQAFAALGRAHLSQENDAQAEYYMKRAFADADAYHQLARTALKLGKAVKAEGYLRKSLELNPNGEHSDHARYDLAKALLEQGRIDEAEALVQELVKRNPGNTSLTRLANQIQAARKNTAGPGPAAAAQRPK